MVLNLLKKPLVAIVVILVIIGSLYAGFNISRGKEEQEPKNQKTGARALVSEWENILTDFQNYQRHGSR